MKLENMDHNGWFLLFYELIAILIWPEIGECFCSLRYQMYEAYLMKSKKDNRYFGHLIVDRRILKVL